MRTEAAKILGKILGLISFLYIFLVSIKLIGTAFKYLGGGVAETLLSTTSDPLIGLFAGILATSVVQSSSTVTSVVVGLVGGGVLPIAAAIPIVMGANIGTSVTNTIVSLGHLTRRAEFQRAFAAATVHDFFNIIVVLFLFPIQYATNVLGVVSQSLSTAFAEVGGLAFTSPLKIITNPTVNVLVSMAGKSGWIILLLGFILLAVSLRYIVVLLKLLVLERVERFFGQYIFKTPARSFILGLFLTTLVQSSSVATSIAIPLAGSGVLTLYQLFPYTMGANIGTTVTAILASLATGSPAAVTVAFAHSMFNIIGCIIIWPIRRLPIWLSTEFARWSVRSKWLPIAYVLVMFFVIPLCVYMLR